MSTAWAYLAVSSDVQSESLPEQRSWAEETARANGWRIDRYFEAVSTGKHGVRQLMQTLLEELEHTPKTRRPDRVLMVRVDRTGRGNALDVIAAIAQIRKLGVTIHTRIDGDLRLETAAGSLKTIFDAIQAGLENEARSDRSKAGHRAKRKAGKHAGHAPYGTVLVDGKPQPYEPEAIVVRGIFERRLRDWGTHRLARYASQVAPPKKKADGSTRKMKWGENTIARMLRCQTYRGIVVDQDLFDAVQAIRHAPIDKTAKYEWPLRGALRCGECGHMLSTVRTGNPKYRIRYYTCRNVAAHPDRYPMHRADVVEAQFVELLARLSTSPELLAGFRHADTDTSSLLVQRETLERDLADLGRRRRRVWSLYEDESIPRDEIAARMAELAGEEKRLKDALDAVRSELSLATQRQHARTGVAEAIGQIARAWTNAPIEEKREAAKAVSSLVGGLWLAPPPPRGASKSRLHVGDTQDR